MQRTKVWTTHIKAAEHTINATNEIATAIMTAMVAEKTCKIAHEN